MSGLFRFACVLLCVGALSATAADAQRTGSRLGANASEKDGRAALQIIAGCYYERRPKQTREWLEMLPGSKEESVLVSRDTDSMGDCTVNDKLVLDGAEIHFMPNMLRRPLATALVRHMLMGMRNIPAPTGVSAPWFAAKLAELPPGNSVDMQALALQDFGHCVVLTKWEDSKALIRSEIGSREEKAALDNIIPALGPCVTKDQKITLKRNLIRDLLAEPLYHLLSMSRDVARQ